MEALTPNNLIIGQKLNLNGVNSNENIEQDVNKRYDHFQKVLEHFVKRWKSKYLTELSEFRKSKGSIGSVYITVVDIVLIGDDKKSRAATVKYLQKDRLDV